MNSRRRKNPHDSSSNRASNRDNIAPRTTTKRTRFTKIINGDARRNEKEKSAAFNSFIRVVHWSTSKLERFCVKRNWKGRGGGEWNVIKTCRRVVQVWPPSRGCVVHLENNLLPNFFPLLFAELIYLEHSPADALRPTNFARVSNIS